MNHFTKLSKLLTEKDCEADVESRMLFVLSIIAQFIKEQPKFYFPFTRKFLLNVFSIDNGLLENCSQKDSILAILAVIYSNLSNQGRLMKKLNVENELKNALLFNFSLIGEIFSLKLFNRAILNLAGKGIVFTSAQLSRYSVLETISNFINKSQVQLFMVRVKKTLLTQPAHSSLSAQQESMVIAEE